MPNSLKTLSPKALWNHSRPYILNKLSGDYEVRILSGPFLPLGWFYKRWEKSIDAHNYTNKGSGHNVINGRRCGYFNIHYSSTSTQLNYATPQNVHTYWHNLCDHIRRLPYKERKYIGQIYYSFLNKPRFLGYFTLTPKETLNESILRHGNQQPNSI